MLPNCIFFPPDVNECMLGRHNCTNAACVNSLGAYECKCLPGFVGTSENTCEGKIYIYISTGNLQLIDVTYFQSRRLHTEINT